MKFLTAIFFLVVGFCLGNIFQIRVQKSYSPVERHKTFLVCDFSKVDCGLGEVYTNGKKTIIVQRHQNSDEYLVVNGTPHGCE